MAVVPKRHGGASAADKAVEQIIERIHEAPMVATAPDGTVVLWNAAASRRRSPP
jgi:hypothetical protein